MQQKTPEEENLWLEELYSQFQKLTKMQSNALIGILEGSLPVEEWLAFFATLPMLSTAYGEYRMYRNEYPLTQPKMLPVSPAPSFFTKLFTPGKAKQMQAQSDLDVRSNEHIANMFREDATKNEDIMRTDPLNMQKSIGDVILFISTLKDDLKKGQLLTLKVNEKTPQSVIKDTKTKGTSTIKVLRTDLMDISAKFADNSVLQVSRYKETTEKSKYKPKTGNRVAKIEKIGYDFVLSAPLASYDVMPAPATTSAQAPQKALEYVVKPTKHHFVFKLKEAISAKPSFPINDLKFSLGLIAQAYQRLKPKKV